MVLGGTSPMQAALVLLYLSVLLCLCLYGVHRAHLSILCARHGWRVARAARRSVSTDGQLPVVTLQLPLYNEATVASRLIQAVGKLDYALDRIEIQVLDDSTDETRRIAQHDV